MRPTDQEMGAIEKTPRYPQLLRGGGTPRPGGPRGEHRGWSEAEEEEGGREPSAFTVVPVCTGEAG